jgi:cell division protein FtsZ
MDSQRHTVIKIIGLGGGGSNAVDRMIESKFDGVEFIAANTDLQALSRSLAPTKIHLGPNGTRGLGAGGKPEVGEAAARESEADLREALQGADLVFLTAGLGGGTGSGAIPVAAEVARSVGAIAVAVVTMPFAFEASRRQQNAQASLLKLRTAADTLVTVPNDKLLGLLPKTTTFELSLRVADEVLRQGVQGITELISRPGLINTDFANIRALMAVAGPSMMAIGQGAGEHKAVKAVRQALQMPLLDLKSVGGATGVLVHFTGGEDLALYEVSQAASEISTAAPNAEVIFGATIDPVYAGRAQVILVVTGVETQALEGLRADIVFRRPITARPRTGEPEPAAPAAQGGDLAEALFSQAVSGADKPDELRNPAPAAAPASISASNSLDLPAFLRRRRGSFSEGEGG